MRKFKLIISNYKFEITNPH
ncbi:unnamed protein product [Spodoptera littoralis]|uniref:Uncharacterized protein n=1 Tax=Spodoptera littoralis TaxID=7109 RepID=A0A9P0NA20_SPOLI|nr:unnamed protein product [Spodoptera littoralis]CAH1646888.1 unnamed protein product [Spodoptera littoralis]